MSRDLYLFDIDGTIIRSFLREGAGRHAYDDVEVLPGRRERLAELLNDGARIALVTNQGGVAMGYQDPPQVCRKIAAVWNALGFAGVGWADEVICCDPGEFRYLGGTPVDWGDGPPPEPCAYVAFHHPNARRDRWRREDQWRKPGGGMLLAAIKAHRTTAEATLYVGDMDSDRGAAEAAGVAYRDATDFFGSGDE